MKTAYVLYESTNMINAYAISGWLSCLSRQSLNNDKFSPFPMFLSEII